MGKEKSRVSILNDYNEYPGPRYTDQGDASGEDFYIKVLNGAFFSSIKNNQILEINLDNTAGYASSFLDEAFGNLVYDFTLSLVKNNISIVSNDEPSWISIITEKTFPQWEKRRENKDSIKHTVDFSGRKTIMDI